jgi:hypothetical protein
MVEEVTRGAVIPPQGQRILEELERRDPLFPGVLEQVAAAAERDVVTAGA